MNSISQGDCRDDEASARHPEISQHAVQQLSRPFDGGFERNSGAKLASEGTPGALDVGEPQDHVGDVCKPQRFRVPPLHRQTESVKEEEEPMQTTASCLDLLHLQARHTYTVTTTGMDACPDGSSIPASPPSFFATGERQELAQCIGQKINNGIQTHYAVLLNHLLAVVEHHGLRNVVDSQRQSRPPRDDNGEDSCPNGEQGDDDEERGSYGTNNVGPDS